MNSDTNQPAPLQRIVCGIFIVVGLLVCIGVLLWGVKTYRFVSRATTAQGMVTALDAGGSHPKIKFSDAKGEDIEYSQNGLIFGYQVGDQPTVLYDARNPREACVNTFGALWGFQTLGLFLGICFVAVGGFAYFGYIG